MDLNSSLPQEMSFESVGTCQMIAKGYVLSVTTKEVERRERGMKERGRKGRKRGGDGLGSSLYTLRATGSMTCALWDSKG